MCENDPKWLGQHHSNSSVLWELTNIALTIGVSSSPGYPLEPEPSPVNPTMESWDDPIGLGCLVNLLHGVEDYRYSNGENKSRAHSCPNPGPGHPDKWALKAPWTVADIRRGFRISQQRHILRHRAPEGMISGAGAHLSKSKGSTVLKHRSSCFPICHAKAMSYFVLNHI